MWQHVKLSVQIRPWDILACCWDVKQPTNKKIPNRFLSSTWYFDPPPPPLPLTFFFYFFYLPFCASGAPLIVLHSDDVSSPFVFGFCESLNCVCHCDCLIMVFRILFFSIWLLTFSFPLLGDLFQDYWLLLSLLSVAWCKETRLIVIVFFCLFWPFCSWRLALCVSGRDGLGTLALCLHRLDSKKQNKQTNKSNNNNNNNNKQTNKQTKQKRM